MLPDNQPFADGTAAAPPWQQVLTDLRQRLADEEFGDAFPGELTLVQQYGVSRHTVRETLRQLRVEGPRRGLRKRPYAAAVRLTGKTASEPPHIKQKRLLRAAVPQCAQNQCA